MENLTVVNITKNKLICRFSWPEAVQGNQGRKYENHFSNGGKILRSRRKEKRYIMCSLIVERLKKRKLNAYVVENHRDLDESIQYVMMTDRSFYHKTS